MGCYVDRNRRRALPHEVHGRFYSAEDCHVECNKAGYKYFARQWRGQCFCGNHVSVYGVKNDAVFSQVFVLLIVVLFSFVGMG